MPDPPSQPPHLCSSNSTIPSRGDPEGETNGCGSGSWTQLGAAPVRSFLSSSPYCCLLYFSGFKVVFFPLLLFFPREDLDQEEKARFGEYCSSENGKGREWFARFVSAQVRAGAGRSAQVRGGDRVGAGGV